MGCGASSVKTQIEYEPLYSWLSNISLEIYYDKLVSEGYDHPDFLISGYQRNPRDIEILIRTIKMNDNDKKIFIKNLFPVIVLAKPVYPSEI